MQNYSYICIWIDLKGFNERIMKNTTTFSFFSYESVHLKPNEQITAHQQETWELSYVITGRGKRLIGDTVSPFESGEVVFIPPQIPHCWYFDKEATDEEGKIANITLVIGRDFLERCAYAFPVLADSIEKVRQKTDAVQFGKADARALIALLEEMRDMTDAERIASAIQILLRIARCETDCVIGHYQKLTKEARRLERIRTYVICNAGKGITIDDIASHVGMNRSAFCIFFKKATGKTFITYLNEYRTELACRLLKRGEMNISEVCFHAGFNNLSYFNRVFKALKGMTPGEWRCVGK